MKEATRPPNFLETPGDPAIDFDQWLIYFRNYVLAIGGDAYSDERLKALLLNCLGIEGQRQYIAIENVPLSTPVSATSSKPAFERAVQRLRDRFVVKKAKVTIRAEFRGRQQRSGESISDYLCALRVLAAKADFRNYNEEQAIMDQIISHTTNDKIRERLLLEGDALTLDRAIELAVRIETAQEESLKLSAVGRQNDDAAVARIARSRPNDGQRGHIPSRDVRCYRCGRAGHMARQCRRRFQVNSIQEGDQQTEAVGIVQTVSPPRGDM